MDVVVRAGAPLAMAGWLLYKVLRERQAQSLDGALVLVTGASSGIGRELALLLTARGADVIIVARTESALRDVEAEVNRRGWGGRIYAYPCDCSDGAQVEALVQRVRAIGGARADDAVPDVVVPDVVVNAAGAGRWLMLDEATVDEVKTGFDAPVLAAANLCRAFIGDMTIKGGGAFVNVQSPGGISSWGGATAYLSARWAFRGLTLALQADLAGTGIKVQEVMLPAVESGYWKNNPDSRQRVPWISEALGVPTISSRRAAALVARAIESRASFSSFGGTLPLLTALNMLCPSIISRLVSLTAPNYSSLIRKNWGEAYFATRPPRRPTPIAALRPSLLPVPSGGTPASPRERRTTPRASAAASKMASARVASASTGAGGAGAAGGVVGGSEPFQLFPTQLPVPNSPNKVDPLRLSEEQTEASKKSGSKLAGAQATPLVGLPARKLDLDSSQRAPDGGNARASRQEPSGAGEQSPHELAESFVMPDDDDAHQAAAAEREAEMANKIAVGRDQLRLLEQRLEEKTREVAKLRSAGADDAAFASSGKLTAVTAAQGALQRLLDDARGRHSQLKAEFDRLHNSPSGGAPPPVSGSGLPAAAADGPPVSGDAEQSESATAGGLGIMLSQEHNGVQIVVIEPGSPAALSNGLFRGDVLRAVDDVATRGKSEQEVLDMLKGPPGQKVTLRVKASGPGTPIREVVLVRGGAADSVRRRQSSVAT